jgi:nitronate monooxygenase
MIQTKAIAIDQWESGRSARSRGRKGRKLNPIRFEFVLVVVRPKIGRSRVTVLYVLRVNNLSCCCVEEEQKATKMMKNILQKLRIPVIQAPMAGGYNTIELVTNVANYGCVGSFGFAYSTPEKIEVELKKVQQQTNGVIHANFFVFHDVTEPNNVEKQKSLNALRSLPYASTMQLEIPHPPYFPDLFTQIEPIWACKPQLLSFHFGLPPLEILHKAKNLGIQVGISATTLDEFLIAQGFGADFVIAQGVEAGGHRGIFDPYQEDEKLPLEELLRIIYPHAQIPVIAAGGIMNGQDIKKALSLGASAVQMGTKFLTCPEAGTNIAHKREILKKGRNTVLTNTFSGRYARGLENEFIRLMSTNYSDTILPFPIQNILTSSIRKHAIMEEYPEYQSLWVGSEYRKCEELPVRTLLDKLEMEYLSS